MENGTQMTLAEFGQEIYRKPNVTVSDFHAKLSALLDCEEALKMHEEIYSLRSCGLLKSDTLKYCSQKMLTDYLTTMGGVTFQIIICAMAELGYSVEWQVLDSQNFGVPQHRERVFIIGHLGEECKPKVFPFATDYPKADELQGQRGIISNTIASGKRDSVGCYPMSNGGGTESERLPQGIVLKKGAKPKIVDISATIDTRIGALPNFAETYIQEK